ncbi:MAG: arsenosugar biosynthesis radical SAM (seleno)protein ArsS [Myxococcota bacterium]|nr:arsenosugar biosynthesis radical SAM (seleno)protein ArsS [Myxococcota bacterium]
MDELYTIESAAADLADSDGRPRRTQSLSARRSPLVSPTAQLESLSEAAPNHRFETRLATAGFEAGLTPTTLDIFQINLGKLCNMTCQHCHVDAGPDRVIENMDEETVEACLRALDLTDAHTVDITGGAPELNPHFRRLVDECVQRGKHVIDRCNLTVLLLPRHRDLPQWLADRGVEIVCSLPHYRARNTDAQRGDGTYEKSIKALKRLNEVGYGQGDPSRILTLMSNPSGAFLAGDQGRLEAEWKNALSRNHGISFDRLFCLNNMPISRFLEWLLAKGQLSAYMERLTSAFNPATVQGLMCRNTLSVSWDGRLFDCDFNQMLDLELGDGVEPIGTIHNFDFQRIQARRIRIDRHCFGCTAGAGSSCGGATT